MAEQTFTRSDGTKVTLGELLKESAGEAQNESMSNVDLAKNLARAIGQGLSFGFADEAEGFARSILGDETYTEARDSARAGLDQFRTQSPYLAYGAEIAASIPAGIMAAPKIAATASKFLPKLGGMAGKVASPVGVAGVEGAAYGAGQAENLEDVPTSALIAGTVGSGLQRASPVITAEAKKLLAKGVPLTVGQSLGGAMKTIEEAAGSVPFLGGVIAQAQSKSQQAFNRAVFDEALEPINITIPKDIVGSDAYAFASDAIKKSYGDVIPDIGAPFKKTVKQFSKNYKGNMRPEDLLAFERIIKTEIIDRVRDGKLTGQAFKDAQSAIRELSYNFKTAPDAYQKGIGDALYDVSFELTEALAGQSPQLAAKLRATDKAYSMLQPLKRATIKGEGESQAAGIFTPAQLKSSIQSDARKRSDALARGDVALQNTSRLGTATIGNKLADSGTATRGVVTNALIGGAGGSLMDIGPQAAAVGAIGSSLYTPTGQYLARKLGVPAVGGLMRSPAVASYLSQVPQGLMSEAQASEMQSDPYSGIPRVTIRPSDRYLLD